MSSESGIHGERRRRAAASGNGGATALNAAGPATAAPPGTGPRELRRLERGVMDLTPQERRLTWLLLGLTGFYSLAFLANIGLPLVWAAARSFTADHLPFVAGSAVRFAALAALAFGGFVSVRRNRRLVKLLILAVAVSIIVHVLLAAFGAPTDQVRPLLWAGAALNAGIAVALVGFLKSAVHSRGDAEVFNEIHRDTFTYLVDAIIPPPEERGATPEQLTRRFETFIRTIDPIAKDLLRTGLDALAPLLRIVSLEPGEGSAREKLRARIRRALESADDLAHDPARMLHTLITYLYYSDPGVDRQLGYVRFNRRSRPEAREPVGTSRLRVRRSIPKREYDVCIVGSGVAGSLLANRLSRAGAAVLVLEAGRYHPEGEITDDEFLMLGQLYKVDMFGGALGGALTVLQAECVGGGSVINNAVCLRLPAFVRQEWAGLGAELDGSRLDAAFDSIGRELRIKPADAAVRTSSNGRPYLNPARERFLRGVEALGIPHGTGDPAVMKPGFYTLPVNLDDCLGCGYCDIGCPYERKVNTLKNLLPAAVAAGDCDIVAEARVEEVITSGGQAVGLRVRMHDGNCRLVHASQYVLSAGAIASSEILLRSDIGRRGALPIGEGFSANAQALVHGRFPGEPVDAYDGLQVTDYLLEPNPDGSFDWMGETWFNPPGAHSQAIPGYLDEHFRRVRAYRHYGSIGTVVGSEPAGRVVLNLWNGRARLLFRLPEADLAKLKRAMARCSTLLFEAGASEVLLMTRSGLTLRSTSELARIENEVRTSEDLHSLATGHPMGGNRMSDDPALGVVGTDFRVRGMENLFVCDASVFPTSARVNPQWTVMALAELCANEVASAL